MSHSSASRERLRAAAPISTPAEIARFGQTLGANAFHVWHHLPRWIKDAHADRPHWSELEPGDVHNWPAYSFVPADQINTDAFTWDELLADPDAAAEFFDANGVENNPVARARFLAEFTDSGSGEEAAS